MIRTVTATRYVMPFRQGGSVPALVEADDESLYVLKFSAAGQGPKALIAELVAGEIGALSQVERFRWLTSPRNTCVQVSPVHSGLCDDPLAALDALFEKMVC